MSKTAHVQAETNISEATTLIFETLTLAVKEKGDDALLAALNLSAEMMKTDHNRNRLILPFAADSWQMRRINRIWAQAPKSKKSVFFFEGAPAPIAVAKPKRKRKPRKQVPQVAPGAPLADVTAYVSAVTIREEDETPLGLIFKAAAEMKLRSSHT